MLMERTQPVLDKLSRTLGEPIITYWNSNKGSICQNDVAGLYALVRKVGTIERLTLFVKSDGGSGQASLRMVNLLRRYVKHLTVLAPLECQSAATMLALGADKILMGPLAHLSAVDTSLTHDLSPIDRGDPCSLEVFELRLRQFAGAVRLLTSDFIREHYPKVSAVDAAALCAPF